MKEDRKPNDEQRKEDFETSAFQKQPNRGAWTGGWRDLPGQKTWLATARRTIVEDGAQPAAPVDRARPDGEIVEDVCGALADLDGKVHVEVLAGEVVLQGRVSAGNVKLDAQRAAASVPGVRVVHNFLDLGSGPAG